MIKIGSHNDVDVHVLELTGDALAPDGIAAAEHFAKWFDDNGLKTSSGCPQVFFHGTNAGTLINRFQPGGDGNSLTSGDAYGVAAYFTSSAREAAAYARDGGAVYPVLISGHLLNLDRELTQADKMALTKLAKELLLPSDKARFPMGRTQQTFDDVADAEAFFWAQKKNWECFGDGMCRAKPEVVSGGPPFVIEYTNYDAEVEISSTDQAYTLFKAVGWDNVRAAGYDGFVMGRDGGHRWVILSNTEGTVKSAVGNNGLYDAWSSDLVDENSTKASLWYRNLNRARAEISKSELSGPDSRRRIAS
jgi:hypothetical protein